MKRKPRRPAAHRAKSSSRKTSRPKTAAAKAPRLDSSRNKVRAHRARMRARGFRLVQMWLPDTRTAEFAAAAHRSSLAIANSPTERDDQDFVDAVSWWTSEENTG